MRGGGVAVLAALALFATSACGDDGATEAGGTTSRATTESSTSSPSTSTTEASTSVTVGIICTSPQDAASALVSAWTAADRAAATRCASELVVDQLFATSGAGNAWMEQGCDAADPAAPVCAYSYEGGAAFLTTTGTDSGGWHVTALRFLAD